MGAELPLRKKNAKPPALPAGVAAATSAWFDLTLWCHCFMIS
jgi:hypothetical protein